MCQLVLSLGSRVHVASPKRKAVTNVLQFVWVVPKAVRPGHWQARLSCARTRHSSTRTIRAAGVRRGTAPLARSIQVVVVRPDRLPTGLGSGGEYKSHGEVIVHANEWFGGHGVDVHSNGNCPWSCFYEGRYPSYYGSEEYQCVELAYLFVTQEFHDPIIGGNANELYAHANERFYERHPNGSGYVPVAGDLITFGGGKYGHVVIVDQVSGNNVDVVEQNASASGRNVITIHGSTLSSYGKMAVIGIIHAKANTNPPGPGGAPVFTADTPPSSVVAGVPYSYTFTASGSPAPTFSLGSGVLPPGLSLSGSGVLSGAPTTSGAYSFTVNATNSAGTTASPSITVVVGQSRTLAADVNGDGRADLVAVNDTSAWVMLSTGSSFSAPADWHEGAFYGSRATLACDVNGDGRADLVAVNDSSVWVMLSTGSGFSGPQLWSSGTFYGSRVTLCADINGDGKADLIAVNDTSAWVMLSTGSSFSAPADWHEGAFYGSRTTVAGDINGDGKADLIAVNDTSAWVMLSTGSSFSAPADWHEGAFYGS
jgi:hypothetical protein